MNAILKTAFAKVKAIVDERLSLRDARRKAAIAKRRSAPKIDKTSEFCVDEGYASDATHEILIKDVQLRSPRIAASYRCASKCMSCLPAGLRIPSPEPRLPNLNAANLSFAARLIIAIRDKFDGDAPKVYTAAGVTRQAYSQIVSDETRPVSKRTAVRFAFALHSTPEEARLLLKSAGYAFSNSRTEDFILQACLEVDPPIWDLTHVNKLLCEYRVDFQY